MSIGYLVLSGLLCNRQEVRYFAVFKINENKRDVEKYWDIPHSD